MTENRAVGQASAAVPSDGHPWRVVVHLDEADPNRQHLAVANLANLLDDLGDQQVVAELVANGPGLDAVLTRSTIGAELIALMTRGVAILACANTLRARRLSATDLLVGVELVPAGISHLVRRQHEGWAYVRP